MGEIKLDPRLVAAGFDRNKNGIVSDELKIDAPIDHDGNGQVSVAELAGALGSDTVVISGSYVKAAQPGKPADVPEIRTMASIHEISKDYSLFGGPQYPGWKYQETRTRDDGSTYTVYHWREAISELQAKLHSIRAIASNQNDFRSRTIAQMADTAIRQNFWAEFLDEGTYRSRYSALYTAMQNIHTMSEVPPQPQETVDGMAKTVNGAGNAVGGLRQRIADPATRNADAAVQKKAAELREKARNIPWWQFLLIFGFFKRASLNNQARRLEENLAVLKAANPDALQDKVNDVARRAYEVGQASWTARNIDDAQALANNASPINQEANALAASASDQARKIQDLLSTISK